jgi:hypothetical protein
LAFLLVAGLLAGCQSKQNEPMRSNSSSGGTSMAPSGERADQSNMALVRFINADPSMKTASAYMDSNQAFSDVSFKTVTPYREVPDGSHEFHLGDRTSMQAGRDNTGNTYNDNNGGISESKSLSSGNYYTVVLLPTDNAGNKNADRNNRNNTGTTTGIDNNHSQMAQLKVINDDFGSPSKDKAQIRVIDAASHMGKVDVYARPKNDDLFSSIDVDSDPSYKEVDPGNVTLEVRPDGKKNALFTLPAKMVDAGHYYTVVITSKGTNSRNLDAVIVEDQYAMHHDTNKGDSDAMDNARDRNRDNDNDNR